VLLEGRSGCGGTALAAHIAALCNFPFTKTITPDQVVHLSESGRCAHIARVFEDSHRCAFSCIIVDNLERLLDYNPLGPRFSNAILQTLLTYLKKAPPREGRKLLVLCTTGTASLLHDMECAHAFTMHVNVPFLERPAHLRKVMDLTGVKCESSELAEIAQHILPIGIKQLLILLDMAVQNDVVPSAEAFLRTYRESGLATTMRPQRPRGTAAVAAAINAIVGTNPTTATSKDGATVAAAVVTAPPASVVTTATGGTAATVVVSAAPIPTPTPPSDLAPTSGGSKTTATAT